MLDFSYSKPFGDIGDVGNTLQFGLKGNIIPPVPYPNIIVNCHVEPEIITMNDSIEVRLTVSNTGNADAEKIEIDLNDNQNIIDKWTIGELEVNSDTVISWFFYPEYPMTANYTVIADINNHILESEEDDNRCPLSYKVVQQPEAIFAKKTKTELRLDEIEYMYQDEGMVPRIFFEKNKTSVDSSRFMETIVIIAERMSENPDVYLDLTGYICYDENDSSLARKRAETVKNIFIDMKPEIADRIIMPENWDIRKLRVPERSFRTQDNEYLLAENRRVELSIIPKNNIATEIDFMGDPTRFLKDNNIKAILDKNPHIVVIASGDSKTKNSREALEGAEKIRNKILKFLGDEYAERVFASSARIKGLSDNGNIIISADGILYRPEVVHASKNYKPDIFPEAQIGLDITGEEIVNWSLQLLDQDDNIVHTIAQGNGAPPEDIAWDFKTDDGNPIPIDKDFQMKYSLTDIYGQKAEKIFHRKIRAIVENAEYRIEKLLVLQFEFDKPASQSLYLEDRLGEVARRIINTIDNSGETSITVEGHTDIIGVETRNQELSVERAMFIKDALEIHMAVILGYDQEALQIWLKENNVRIEAKGYASEEPYYITSWEDGAPKELLVGDNKRPEGRTINRRVLITISSEK